VAHAGGGEFAIWFYVVIDPDARQALWIRHTRRRDAHGGGEAINWAAAWGDARAPLALKSLHAADVLVARADGAKGGTVMLGDATFEATRAKGRVESQGRSLAWDFSYEPATGSVARAPAFVEWLPLPVHSEHVHARTRVSGFFEVDGVRHLFGPRARMVQARIWGTAQPEEIFWIWAPSFDGIDAPGAGNGLEFLSARLHAHAFMPRLSSLVLEADALRIDDRSLLRTARTRLSLAGPFVLEVRSLTRAYAIVTRAFASQRDFVGYVYRGPDGSEVYVAHCDTAQCEVSVHRRRPLGGRVLERVLTSSTCALEIHQKEPLPGVDYLPWLAPGPVTAAAYTVSTSPRAGVSSPLPPIADVLAIGLSYADHVRETGSRVPATPVVFRKGLHAVVIAADTAPTRIAPPSAEEMIAALTAIEPGIADLIRSRFPVLPALMDYEVEIGLVLLEPMVAASLDDRARSPRFAWFLANDLTARSCQILGEGMKDTYAYWAVAKGFPRFLPVSPIAIAEATSLDELPAFELTTHVNGELRQRGTTKDLLYTPREMLRAASRFLGGDLPAGLAIITGTPAGVGLSVPRWKRALADVALDRFGKLAAAAREHAHGGRLLRAGDLVTCAATGLGLIEVVLGTSRPG
jgi:2-keto-4-pentenoate hydratase/2-oxohepta-3-ene-1,7-dioic acid hydratase in catechol pathway